jgi:hypothetical protein
MKSTNREFKSCFISAPFGASLGALPRVLDRAEIQWEWARSNLDISDRLPGDLRKIIKGVDFVIGVILGGSSSDNIMFEVGLAVGMGKPVLLVGANQGKVPTDLAGIASVQASLDDETALALHLDLLIRSSRQGPRYPVSGQTGKTSIGQFPDLGLRSSVKYDSKPESALEGELVTLIERAGGRTLLHPRLGGESRQFTPDVLFWLPTEDIELLNPAVVELKGHLLTSQQLIAAEDQLLQFLQQTGVRTGLLIVRGLGLEARGEFRGNPLLNIFRLDFEKFRSLVTQGELASYLRQERNRAAHGLR